MKTKQIEAYDFYKKLYPSAVILFHVGSRYVALQQDAMIIAKILSINVDCSDNSISISDDDLKSLSHIGDYYEVKIISHRDRDGGYDYPDVNQLKREQDEDF